MMSGEPTGLPRCIPRVEPFVQPGKGDEVLDRFYWTTPEEKAELVGEGHVARYRAMWPELEVSVIETRPHEIAIIGTPRNSGKDGSYDFSRRALDTLSDPAYRAPEGKHEAIVKFDGKMNVEEIRWK